MIESILKAIYLPQDKANHVVWGAILFAAGHFVSIPFAAAVVLAVAIFKELYDSYHPDRHSVDPMDAVATAAGGVVGFICTL